MLENKLYNNRFELFLISQLGVLFGSLFFPFQLFESFILPLLLLINLTAGVVLAQKKPILKKVLIGLIVIGIIAHIVQNFILNVDLDVLRLVIYFLFYILVVSELITQVWKSKIVNKNIISGLVSGYISLGLIAFFICLSIEALEPNSFSGINAEYYKDDLMYYSYITLLTIGYGDVLPITPLAQKAAIFIGLIGQMYLVVITAIVVGKYINQISYEEKE